MSSLSISYLTGIVLASCGAFGAVYVGNMIFPIKGPLVISNSMIQTETKSKNG